MHAVRQDANPDHWQGSELSVTILGSWQYYRAKVRACQPAHRPLHTSVMLMSFAGVASRSSAGVLIIPVVCFVCWHRCSAAQAALCLHSGSAVVELTQDSVTGYHNECTLMQC